MGPSRAERSPPIRGAKEHPHPHLAPLPRGRRARWGWGILSAPLLRDVLAAEVRTSLAQPQKGNGARRGRGCVFSFFVPGTRPCSGCGNGQHTYIDFRLLLLSGSTASANNPTAVSRPNSSIWKAEIASRTKTKEYPTMCGFGSSMDTNFNNNQISDSDMSKKRATCSATLSCAQGCTTRRFKTPTEKDQETEINQQPCQPRRER